LRNRGINRKELFQQFCLKETTHRDVKISVKESKLDMCWCTCPAGYLVDLHAQVTLLPTFQGAHQGMAETKRTTLVLDTVANSLAAHNAFLERLMFLSFLNILLWVKLFFP
jgi:hypothetical protein